MSWPVSHHTPRRRRCRRPRSPRRRSARRGAALLVGAVLCCALAVAACGGSPSKSGRKGTGGAYASFLTFSKCMRGHGLTNFPDPRPGGGLQIPNGVDVQSPQFKSAQSACRHLLPGGGPPSGPPSASAMQAAVKMSQCMRRHGITGFPDPTTTPLSPSDINSYSLAEDRDGVVIAVPRSINPNSPAFKQAAATCHFS